MILREPGDDTFEMHSSDDATSRTPLSNLAAGTGLTGHSDQEFRPVHVGKLEDEATVIRLRLIVGTDEEISAVDDAIRPLAAEGPARPAARP